VVHNYNPNTLEARRVMSSKPAWSVYMETLSQQINKKIMREEDDNKNKYKLKVDQREKLKD
jgi:hypothetical protein